MELTERVPMKPIQWLSQLSFKEFSQKRRGNSHLNSRFSSNSVKPT